MPASRSLHHDRDVFCALVTLAAVLLSVSSAGSEELCVQDEDDLWAALSIAGSNYEDDTILIVRGDYLTPSAAGHFYYSSSRPDSLSIEGDYGISFGDCARLWSPKPEGTTIDGGGFAPALAILVDTDEPVNISVKYLTFENGYQAGSGAAAGGLEVLAGDKTSVTVEANIFSDNVTEGSGGGLHVDTNSRLRVINNLFTANVAGVTGGAAALFGNGPGILDPGVEIYNNTVAYNTHTGSGWGGLWIGGTASVCYIDNNIFWGNGGGDLSVSNPNCTLLNNDIEVLSGTPAWNQGAMNVYPEWKSLALGQYQLADSSPLINQGLVRITNHSMPSYDLDGLPRFSWDSPVDIGAYEVQFMFYDGFDDGTTGGWSVVVR